jgi:ribosomal protein S18 acetylase RimI-like enzyme
VSAPIAALDRARLGHAAHVLARAFADDPAFVALWPEPVQRGRALRHLMAVPLADALRHGHVEAVAAQDGAIVGAAVWYPPGAAPMGGLRRLRSTPRILAVGAAAPSGFRRFARFGDAIAEAFPDDRPWYLAVIGVAPEGQGRGLGGRLVGHGLERAGDADVYLETASPRAAALYTRLGFDTVEEAVELLPGGPPHRLMRRNGGPQG